MADLYVSTNGSDYNAGTKDSPFKTILKASQVASAGSTVHVAPGNYQGGFTTTANNVTYVSDVKWGAKITSGSGSMAWNNKGDGVTINGFEVDGTNAGWRIGIYTTGTNSIVENSKVHDIASNPATASSSSGGAGIYGDGYYGDTNITLRNNVIYEVGPAGQNSSLIHGIYHSTTGTIANNLVYNNAGVGLHLWHDARDVDLVNNTVFNNNMGAWIGGGDNYRYFGSADYVNVSNNIFYDNRSYGIAEGGSTGTHNTYTSNLVYGNGTNIRLQNGLQATGTVSADPRFVNYQEAGGGDYHLTSTSPAINKGTSTYAPTLDMEGKTREGAVDIGVYEYKSTTTTTPPPSPTPTPTPTPTTGTSKIVVNAWGSPAGGVNAHFNLLIDGKKIGEGVAGTTAKDYSFDVAVTNDLAHKVQVQFDNDTNINGQDRNLYVNKITINGKAVAPTDGIVTYDKGALDGKDVVKGQVGMWWNGTLVVNADKSFFPAVKVAALGLEDAGQLDVYSHMVSQELATASARLDQLPEAAATGVAMSMEAFGQGVHDHQVDPLHLLDAA